MGGNTRYLKSLGQAELAILAKNGDSRVRIKPEEKTETVAEVAAPLEPAEVAEPTQSKKSAKQTPAA